MNRVFGRDAAVLQWLKENNIDVVFVPGGCTAVAQVMDVFVNAKFKSNVRKLFLSWKAEQIKVPSIDVFTSYFTSPRRTATRAPSPPVSC